MKTHAIGEHVSGRVVNVVDYAAFIELAPGVDAFLHVREMDPGTAIAPRETLTRGQDLEVKVLNVDAALGRILVSRRALTQASTQKWLHRMEPGMIVKGTVVRVVDQGALVDVDGVLWLVPTVELSHSPASRPADVVTPGEELSLK